MKIASVCKFTARLVLLAGVAGLLPGCGQYGDLYLPEPAPAEQPPVPPADQPQADDREQEQEQQDP